MHLKPQTASHYRFSLTRYIIPALWDRRLDDISTADVQRLHNSLHTTRAAAFMRTVLCALFGKAIAWEVTTRRNPVTVVQKFDENSVERFLSPEERQALERVLATAERTKAGRRGYVNREAIAAIRLLALTGMRRDEIRDLRWEQVDGCRSILRLPDTKTASGTSSSRTRSWTCSAASLRPRVTRGRAGSSARLAATSSTRWEMGRARPGDSPGPAAVQ